MLAEAVKDIQTTYVVIVCSCLIAMVLGMFWMVIMKMCAACITWCAIIILELSLIGLTYYLYMEGVTR